jgi:hypothetical protein
LFTEALAFAFGAFGVFFNSFDIALFSVGALVRMVLNCAEYALISSKLRLWRGTPKSALNGISEKGTFGGGTDEVKEASLVDVVVGEVVGTDVAGDSFVDMLEDEGMDTEVWDY